MRWSMLALLTVCLGCNPKSKSRDPHEERTLEMSNESQKHSIIQGAVSRTGISRGKTMAAWHGVPPPHPFLVVKLNSNHKAKCVSGGEAYVWFPAGIPQSEIETLVGTQVRLSGQWVDPPQRAPADLYQPEQRPIEHVMMIDIQQPTALESQLHEMQPAESSGQSTPPATQEIKDKDVDKDWVSIDRQAHFQASSFMILK